jgi:hypothetical protein
LQGLKPGTLKEVASFTQRRSAPHPRYSALLFALMSLFLFQIWEAFLRFLLQRDAYILCFVAGFAALTAAIFLRQKRLLSPVETDKRLGSLTLALMCLGFSAMLNSWGTLIFVPWVYFRASFLPRRLG